MTYVLVLVQTFRFARVLLPTCQSLHMRSKDNQLETETMLGCILLPMRRRSEQCYASLLVVTLYLWGNVLLI